MKRLPTLRVHSYHQQHWNDFLVLVHIAGINYESEIDLFTSILETMNIHCRFGKYDYEHLSKFMIKFTKCVIGQLLDEELQMEAYEKYADPEEIATLTKYMRCITMHKFKQNFQKQKWIVM